MADKLYYIRFFTQVIFIFFVLTKSMLAQTHLHSHSYSSQNDTTHSHIHEHQEQHVHTHLKVDYSFSSNGDEYVPPQQDENGFFWWKGNLHTHTLWSDGDQFPEVVTEWYYEQGYHFLALSDHNILSRGQKWINPAESPYAESGGGMEVYDLYLERFGENWVETRETPDGFEVRLKPLHEVRALFEQAGRFIMIDSEEITEREHVVHVNATNVLELIEPQSGETVEETIRLNIDAVYDQREKTGQEMVPHLNHPNFANAVTAEDMAPVENLRLFEVYNGHRGVVNFGNKGGVKNLDRVWDILLTIRLGELGLNPVYGIAVDDAHHYENSVSETARPGRGWIEVRSRYLTAEHIVRSLESGNFYSSTGVKIDNVQSDGGEYVVKIKPEEGVDYQILFIGTKKDYDIFSKPFVDENGQTRNDRTRIYSKEIGRVLQESKGTEAIYRFQGDELYVRAKIISSKLKKNYFMEGEVEKAWLQPLIPGQKYGEMVNIASGN
ncbi:MAG: PHP domain-containing protein [Balneolaceae bacterium]